MRAAGYFAVTANVSAESAEAIGRHLLRRPELAGLQGPTVSEVVSKTARTAQLVRRARGRAPGVALVAGGLSPPGRRHGCHCESARLRVRRPQPVLPGPHRAVEAELARSGRQPAASGVGQPGLQEGRDLGLRERGLVAGAHVADRGLPGSDLIRSEEHRPRDAPLIGLP